MGLQYRNQFAASVHTIDGDPLQSQSRARPTRALPDVSVDYPSARRSQLGERADFPLPDCVGPPEMRRVATRFVSPARTCSLRHCERPVPIDVHSRDERGEEMSNNARIWRIYIDEARKFDTVMIDGWNRSLDVLLVFTGLFSAVLTTFIVQSYSQLLVPNPVDTTNVLLAELLLLQFNTSTPSSLLPSTSIANRSSASQAHWVNGLWFAALACSLSSALISMLAKQWLQAYMPNISGSLPTRARMRQSRLIQLEMWHVPTIINALPLLLHAALLLFFTGLVVLLWSTDLGITLAMMGIVAFAYLFYMTSICLTLVYPDCPYHHPIAEQIRKSTSPKTLIIKRMTRSTNEEPEQVLESMGPPLLGDIRLEDRLDAQALCWLFTKSTDNNIVSAALQAIAGLPKDFSAMHVLWDAGALRLVKQGFQSCFYKDTSMDLEWRLVDVEGAELYCRGWMKLTRGTSELWPMDIIEPLWLLSDLKNSNPDTAAFAACAVALSSLDTLSAQWELLSFLAKFVSGEFPLAQETQCWLLDTITQCALEWVMPQAVIEQTTGKAVPIILLLLQLAKDISPSPVRSAAALALYVFTCGPINLLHFNDEGMRQAAYCEMMVQALAAIADSPHTYGVTDSFLNIVAEEFSRLSSPLIAQSERFPHTLRVLARSSLSKLFVDGRLWNKVYPDTTLANVLQLIFPPHEVIPSQRPIFTTFLVDKLKTTSHPDVMNWAVRLLEALLTQCPMPVLQAFAENNGISTVLCAVNTGNVDSLQLQINSLRVLCTFIKSSTVISTQITYFEDHPYLESQFDLIFQSDFFETLCSIVASRHWWLFEVSRHWMPALLQLCRIRPKEVAWGAVIRTFQDFADRNVGEEGQLETMRQLNEMRLMLPRVLNESDSG